MPDPKSPLIVRLCLLVLRACSALVPSRHRGEWRQEWEGELHHRRQLLEAHGEFGWRQQMDLFKRVLGALPDAAWLRRQFTFDADLVHDVRHGARVLRKSPGFAASAVIILAIGIGSTVAVVTLLDTLMFRALPYDEAERIVTVWQRRVSTAADLDDVAPANFLDWRERATSFSHIAAAIPYSYDSTGTGEPEVLFGLQVTEGFFDALGTRPVLGRPFLADEHVSGARKVVVISDGLWARRFNRDPNVVGRALNMDDTSFTIVGVLPRAFAPQLLARAGAHDVWTPKVVADHDRRIRGSAWWNVVARLKSGVTRAQAQDEIDRISAVLAGEYPRTNAGLTAAIVPLREHLMGNVRTPLLMMLAAALFVLGIGCANVGSLLLARGMGREREFAIRAAMGAGRGRLVRQLVTESLVLSVLAAAAGLALARWTVSAIVALAPSGVLRLHEAAIDGRAVAVAAILATLTAVAFGLVPSLQFSRSGSSALRDRSAAAPRSHARRGLVVAEVALALMLLAGAGLLMRSFQRLMATDPGFSPRNVVFLQVFAYDRNPTADKVRAFFSATLDRLARIPGVREAGAVSAMPFATSNINIKSPIEFPGRPGGSADDRPDVYVTIATPGYFRALSIPLRAGRVIEGTDTERAPTVAVISEALRKREWPGEDPVGRRLAIQWYGQRLEAEIVGVVGQIRHDSLRSAPRAEVFLPLAQVPDASMTFVLQGTGAPSRLIDAGKREVWKVDPLQTFYETASVERRVDASVVRERFSMTLMTAFAAIALLLCATGIYGVISFTAGQRTREIGVRMALGADRGVIERMVLGEGAGVLAVGVAAGLAGAVAGSRLLRTLLFEVEPGDPITFGAVSLLIGTVGLVACYLPARRAALIDPVVAMRDDAAQ